MRLPFAKYSGCGNDFIVIDNRSNVIKHPLSHAKIAKLCHRQHGIGADGIILLENSFSSDFRMRIFNADGSEAEMCGNGVRCLGHFIKELGLVDSSFNLETMHQKMQVSFHKDSICIQMPEVKDKKFSLLLSVDDKKLTMHYLDTGVPHAVLFVEDLTDDVHLALAPKIRHHPYFKPKGTNVNFAAIDKYNNIVNVRTYERGVEAETLACGTGAVATALSAAYVFGLTSPVKIRVKSGDLLSVGFSSELTLTGPATKIFEGIVALSSF